MTPDQPPSPPLWLYPNLLGLDSPAVAVAWQWIFAKCFDTAFPPILHLILGLSVWCIYLADRIYDVLSAKHPETGTDRMRFTHRHLGLLFRVMLIASTVNLYLIIRHVPLHLIVSGLVTALLLAIYYALRINSRSRVNAIVPREILCGMLFALGCAITPHAFEADTHDASSFWIAVGSLGLVCSASCILISFWERDEDLAVNDVSIATDHSKVDRHMLLALPLLAALCIPAALSGNWPIYASVAVSAIALLLMLRFQEMLSKSLLRVLADAVLLTPLIFVWF
ncbi:MAG: hypothetical protein ABJQ29_01835 [Luteolibacter sp.]